MGTILGTVDMILQILKAVLHVRSFGHMFHVISRSCLYIKIITTATAIQTWMSEHEDTYTRVDIATHRTIRTCIVRLSCTLLLFAVRCYCSCYHFIFISSCYFSITFSSYAILLTVIQSLHVDDGSLLSLLLMIM